MNVGEYGLMFGRSALIKVQMRNIYAVILGTQTTYSEKKNKSRNVFIFTKLVLIRVIVYINQQTYIYKPVTIGRMWPQCTDYY